MEKLQSSFKNMVLVLLCITGVAAAALGAIYEVTKAPIANAKAAKQQAAIKAVVPEFDNDPIAEVTIHEVDGGVIKIFPAKKGDQYVGSAIETFTNNGFSGLIKIMVGFDTEGNIVNFSVLEHKETPGLGSKMQDWFINKSNIRGLNPDKDKLFVSKDGGDVDAITAATITSRAFLEAIQRGVNVYQENPVDANTGASQNKEEKKTAAPDSIK
jgi:electron transport complex protein RnfG